MSFKLTDEQIYNNQQFLIALRSGYYKQATGKLRELRSDNTSAFCCLGVATDLYIRRNTTVARWVPPDPQATGEDYKTWKVHHIRTSNLSGLEEMACEEGLPTVKTRDWYGWPEANPVLDEQHKYSATNFNDKLGKNFNEIADLIEEWLIKNSNYTK